MTLRVKRKKDIIISSVILVAFFYFFIFPFLVTKSNQLRALFIIKNNVYHGNKSGLTINNQEKSYSGATILTSLRGRLDANNHFNYAILINNKGEIINEWSILGFPAKLLAGGQVVGNNKYRTINKEETHQESEAVVRLDWEGNEVWRFDNYEPDENGRLISRSHHDIQLGGYPVIYSPQAELYSSSSNKTLILSHHKSVDNSINPNPLEDDVILEVEPDGAISWKWIAAEHFTEFGFTDTMKKAIYNTKLINNSLLVSLGYPNKTVDWLHLNSASYLGPNTWYENGDKRFAPENIIISSRNGCFVAIIDKQTGEVVWHLGPDYSQGSEKTVGQIIGQHDAYIIPRGLPGEGNLLLFDNGGFSCYGNFLGISTFPAKFRNYSRILEINPVSLEIVWEYSQPEALRDQKEFFTWFMGSAQRLPNGNTLISEGATGRIFEVTPSKEIVWEFFTPYKDGKGPETIDLGSYIYSAYRYPNEWIQK